VEIKKAMEKLDPLQEEIAKLKKRVANREQNAVARKMLKEAEEILSKLEGQVEKAAALAAPLISEQKEDFTASIFLSHAMDALRKHSKDTVRSGEELFNQMSGDKSAFVLKDFLAFMAELPQHERGQLAHVGADARGGVQPLGGGEGQRRGDQARVPRGIQEPLYVLQH